MCGLFVLRKLILYFNFKEVLGVNFYGYNFVGIGISRGTLE